MTIAEDLLRALPGDAVVTDPDLLIGYRSDEAFFVDAGMPAVAVLPRSTEEVQAVVRTAAEAKVPIVPRGAGSGLSGGANAIDGCIVLSLQRMQRIVDISSADLLAVVEPGVITGDLHRAAAERGLFYAPDPASSDFCTIGGNVATNAGGLCCVKYGVTADAVQALEVVLADGSVVRTGRRSRKGVAGYDLTRLFVGSEGTLGIVTEATLRLRPAPPEAATLVASFPSLAGAGVAIAQIVSALVPSLLELLDRTTVNAVEDLKPIGLTRDTEALLIARADDRDADAVIERIEAICAESGADMVVRSSTAGEADMLLEARRLARSALMALGSNMLDDVAVPTSQIPALLREIGSIADRNRVVIGTFGHAGDGNLHPTIVFDESSADRARIAFDDIVRAALALGGTITGEHGVGTLKRPYLRDEIGDNGMRLHAAVKQALDPLGILNPGKVF